MCNFSGLFEENKMKSLHNIHFWTILNKFYEHTIYRQRSVQSHHWSLSLSTGIHRNNLWSSLSKRYLWTGLRQQMQLQKRRRLSPCHWYIFDTILNRVLNTFLHITHMYSEVNASLHIWVSKEEKCFYAGFDILVQLFFKSIIFINVIRTMFLPSWMDWCYM